MRSTTSPTHTPRLPNELTDHIIDFLHDDRPTLRACVLTHRVWRPRSRHHLFATATFPVLPGSGTAPRWESFARLIACDPSLAHCVQTLHIISDVKARDLPVPLQRGAIDVARLPNVRIVRITGVSLPIAPILAALKDTLEELVYEDEDGHLPSSDAQGALRRPRRGLRSLRLQATELVDPEETISHVLSEAGGHASLEELVLRVPPWHGATWAPVLHATRHTLQHATVSLCGGKHFTFGGTSFHGDVFTAVLCDALRGCAALRTLTVRYDGIYDLFRPHSPRFFDALVELLLSRDRSGFPPLEALELDVRASTFSAFADIARPRARRLVEALGRCHLTLRVSWLDFDWDSIGMGTDKTPRAVQLATLEELFAPCAEGGGRVSICMDCEE